VNILLYLVKPHVTNSCGSASIRAWDISLFSR